MCCKEFVHAFCKVGLMFLPRLSEIIVEISSITGQAWHMQPRFLLD
jgi:hypothetical protein